jgi:two-component system sensor histidine kinase RegB
MALRVTLGRGLAPSRLTWTATPDRWLIRLRWLALLGMLVTTLVAERLVPGLPRGPVLALLGAIALCNLAWMAVIGGRAPGSTVPAQLASDVLLLGAVLWCSGGLENPFSCFLVFQIVLTGLLARRRTTIFIGLLAIAVALALWAAPPLLLDTAPLGARSVRRLGAGFAVLALAVVTGAYVVVFLQRLRVLRERSARSERLAELGRVVATLCHELNTPLGTMLIAGKDLGHIAADPALPSEVSGEVRSLAATVVAEARRASDIIGLLRGHVNPGTELEPVELSEFLPHYVRSEVARLGYDGELHLSTEFALTTLVYKSALSQILTNLLTNAIDALREREAAALRVLARRSLDGSVEIAVVDSGPGVDPSLGDRVGEPFQTTKQPDRGTGLGLYVSTLLAERLGGSLALESQAGRGTTVRLTLPAAPVGGRPSR